MRSGRKRAAAGEAWGPVAKIVPSKRACFGPSLFSTAIKASPVKSLEDLKSNLNSIEGVFAAYTNSYYTVSRVTNEKGLVLTSGDGGPERQFRMKLPDKSVVAFVAVGCRYALLCQLHSISKKNPNLPLDLEHIFTILEQRGKP